VLPAFVSWMYSAIIYLMSYTKEQARAEIAHLVAHFRANEPSLVNVPEAQIEDNYIRKLFHFLNWNTENTGLSVAEWEFVLQRTDEKGKRPDYLLQLDGQQVLVMDAKKVKYDMHDPRWITQVYAYAYSTQSQPASRKIDFAILTDFQEFILLDCTLYAADLRAVSNFRILDWTYEDYVSQFDTLWELLERENVREAIHTRDTQKPSGLWSRYLSPKKVKANRIPPDKTFLAEMDDENTGWRVRLAKDMKKRNPDADGALITAAVQLLIDRLIFVKALSDREIEADYLIQLAEKVEKSGLAADDAGWFNACRDIFARLNHFYNGSIFEPRPELEAVTVSNKVVRGVIRDLQPENSPYNFAVLPVEILGTIYERFLGRVVRATDQRVKIEDKPEVRKAGGVYYTPQYIVDYIVENTVSRLLSECKTPADAAKLHILDPACGSGSFLLGAYTALIRWHSTYYSDQQRLTQRDRAAAYYDSDGRVRLTAKLKRQILLNNLFGVDIDAQAVEVTRFSLSLKALEDTRRDELYEEVTLFQQTVLPDLHHNIKCGNSLIGPDYFSGQMFADKDELLRVKPFDWAQEFPEVMAAGSFDAVIGNPPYVRQETLGKLKTYFQKTYRVYHGIADLYAYFIEQGVSLLKADGVLGFIVANKWMRANYGEPLRHWLKQLRIEEITDFGDLPVFKSATTYPCILIIRKDSPQSTLLATQVRALNFGNLNEYVQANCYSVNQMQLNDAGWSLANESAQALLTKLRVAGVPLERYVKGQIYYGIKTGLNEAFVIDAETRQRLIAQNQMSAELIKPLLIGREVKRYQPSNNEGYLIFMPRGWTRETFKNACNAWECLQKNYPAIAKHLTPFTDAAEVRLDKGEYWWELRACDYYGEFEKPKIIYPNICKRPEFTFDTGRFYTNQKCFIIPVDDKYLLGILNSSVTYYLFRVILPKLRGGFYEPSLVYFKDFPIHTINFSDPTDKARHDRMVQLVESMLALHKHKAAARTQAEQEQFQRQIDATDRQIDALVYELYGLTSDEIAIVTGQT